MMSASLGLPGRRDRPSDWTPSMTTPARSWAELVETLQGGLAVIDQQWRLTYVSDRFLPVLGTPTALRGHDLRQLLPPLAPGDPRGLHQRVERGERVEFEEQFGRRNNDDRRWFQVAVVPSARLGSGLVAVVFAKEITGARQALSQLRSTTIGLTEVEDELYGRVGRDVHDGPIQLLAALMFRLGLSDTQESHDTQQLVSDVAAMFRELIADFSPELRLHRGPSLQQWIAPFLVGSDVEVEVDDQRRPESGEAETRAAFVLLYHAVRAAKDYGGRRSMRMVLTDEGDGQRFFLEFQSSAERTNEVGRPRAQHRLLEHHARALGGTMSSWLDENEVRRVSMWIPNQSSPSSRAGANPIETAQGTGEGAASDLSVLAPLDDDTWLQIANDAPERLLEFDDQLRVSFANPVQHDLVGAGPDEMIGRTVEELFAAESLLELDGAFERLDRGELVETDWHRDNWLGDSRLIHIKMSPRLGDGGAWQGLLVSTDDRTDVELLQELSDGALADLARARRYAIEQSIQRLRAPLAACERLVGRLEHWPEGNSHAESIRAISRQLGASLERIEGSTSVLTPSRLSIGNLGVALRSSLGSVLEGRRLVVIDNTESPPSTEATDVIFRITREAVNNAVLHGKAGFITITVERRRDGVVCTIHDNGTGIDSARLDPPPGHLGTRAMTERAREQGGTCRIERDPRGGTLVSLWLPDPVTEA